jgi:GntR family transcriptional regulator, transcriptional repressor for pyruvate dehydrogenase complex
MSARDPATRPGAVRRPRPLDVRRSVPGPICEDRYVSRSEALREESPASHAASRRPRFARLEQPRAHEYVAEQLRREITLGLIQAGEKLPSERDLLQLLGVSRFTVQQALNLLETEGLVAARRGRGGGTFVIGAPRNAGGKRRLIARIRRDRDVIAEAVACRVEVEPAAAAQAADLRTEEDLTALRDLLSRAGETSDDREFTNLDARFHLTIVEASRNRFLRDVVERVRLAIADAILVLPETPLWRDKSSREHQIILQAIDAQDADAARSAMASHVGHTARSIAALLETV